MSVTHNTATIKRHKKPYLELYQVYSERKEYDIDPAQPDKQFLQAD